MKRVRGVLAALGSLTCVVSVMLSFPLEARAASPITGSNRPVPISGHENGALPASELINVAPNCRAHRSVAPSLALLLASARNAGVTLGTNECYRPLVDQIAIAKRWANAGNSACAATPLPANGAFKGTSIHGWGKAADFDLFGSWNSPAYRYLESVAWRYGWNHPAWAKPNGSACPEAWHWEWVGDGGTEGGAPIRSDVIALLPSADGAGYISVTGLGAVNIRGNAADFGSAAATPLNWVMVSAASTPDHGGYWMVGADGGVFTYGNARFYGSTGSMKLNKPVVAMAPTPTGNGYWLVASDGGVFSFGDAQFFGSTGSIRLNRPVVGITTTPSGNGYWLVASDGGIFSFGDAQFYGSTGSMKLNQPVIGMESIGAGGYRLIASDGGIFSFGSAPFFGSAGSNPPQQPVVDITNTPSGNGYWIVAANGDVYAYGDAEYHGPG